MKLQEVRDLIRFQPFVGDKTERVLSRCLNTEDLRSMARKRLPRAVFDYVDGGADEEISLGENRSAYQRWSFTPRVLPFASRPGLRVTVCGRELQAPLALCPTGYTRMINPDGETAVARAAAAAGVAYALSTVGTTTIEDLAATGHQDLWFQLFMLRDRQLTRALVERAAAAGFRALELTVDTVVSGRREHDTRNGLTIPPALPVRTVLDIALHLHYWIAMVTSPALEFANIGRPDVGEGQVTAANVGSLFDAHVTWDDVAELRTWWQGPLLLKGPLSPGDAKRAIALGVDGIHLSNHGGRQLDRSVPPLDLVQPLRSALGEGPMIVVDSGIRHGSDIAVSIARGADMCAVGRPYLYGLAVGGERGVRRAIDLLTEQLRRTMQLLGVNSIAELRSNADDLLTRS